MELDDVLKKVEARGGPTGTWNVDLEKRKATWGPFTLTCFKLRGGGFSPRHYWRSDSIHPDKERDWATVKHGETGDPIPSVRSYWFAWQAFYPRTELYKAPNDAREPQ